MPWVACFRGPSRILCDIQMLTGRESMASGETGRGLEAYMAAMLLDGKKLAQTMQGEIAAAVVDMVQKTGVRPGLAAVARRPRRGAAGSGR